ncbi:uncharacterized protein LOC134181660 [Corticium candelabrum]|uniref:uncharacterized protein LOC134181660 n=1 Tax=Corticium candelabrum TaxID=121492 RepID=UPI002E264401|nr:uncharacterized protein LOC134181660 [Corticium candelabrum]
MKTRSRADGILFARRLSKTKGMQDLGKKILSKAGEEFEETSQPVEDTREIQSCITIHTLLVLLLMLNFLYIAGAFLFIMQLRPYTGSTQEDRGILIYLEKQDHSQTVIVVVACGDQLTVSMFGKKRPKHSKLSSTE